MNPKSLTINISPSPKNMGRSIFTLEEFLKKRQLCEETISKILVVFRELVDNAIKYGSVHDPSGLVRAEISSCGQDCFSIKVKDNGKGFDHKNVSCPLSLDSGKIKRRGYHLIREHSDRIEFNVPGNCITVYFNLNAGSQA